MFLLCLLFSARPARALIIALLYFLWHRETLGNDLARSSGSHRGPVHIAQLIEAILFQDGPNAIGQVGCTRTQRLSVVLAVMDYLVVIDRSNLRIPLPGSLSP